MAGGLPNDVAAFIDSSLTSMTDLEVLLELTRAQRAVSPETLANVLLISADHVRQALGALRRAGVVVSGSEPGTWSYAAPDAETQDCVTWLLANFRVYRVAITARIFSGPTDRIAGLAEGFRFRRPKDADG